MMTNGLKLFNNGYYLTDGGMETTLIFHHGIELNHFASFELLNDEAGKQSLKNYYTPYINIASKYGLNYILEAPTWRANRDWMLKLGYTDDAINTLNKAAISFLRGMIFELPARPNMLISGCIGPRGDGYIAEKYMTPVESNQYHYEQIKAFAEAQADVVTAMTINYSSEAIGIALAAKTLNVPIVISFTLEPDGKLPNGETLSDAIEKTDAATDNYVSHFMINCAHPNHFKHILKDNGQWKFRIRGVRANASQKSHAELNESDTLDAGDKCDLAKEYRELAQLLPDLRIVGGCCGTDSTHIEEICRSLSKHRY